jgi:zinc protease
MHVRPARLLIVALLIAATSFTTSAAVRPPKLQYDISTLPNGLTLVLSEDHSTPIVHLQVWYHVGSKNEKKGRTGFAHLFEHLMFKGSKNVGPEEHTSLMTSLGGQSNAYTTDDETVFWIRAGAVSAADDVARGGSHGDTADRQGNVSERARSGKGRAPDARR